MDLENKCVHTGLMLKKTHHVDGSLTRSAEIATIVHDTTVVNGYSLSMTRQEIVADFGPNKRTGEELKGGAGLGYSYSPQFGLLVSEKILKVKIISGESWFSAGKNLKKYMRHIESNQKIIDEKKASEPKEDKFTQLVFELARLEHVQNVNKASLANLTRSFDVTEDCINNIKVQIQELSNE